MSAAAVVPPFSPEKSAKGELFVLARFMLFMEKELGIMGLD